MDSEQELNRTASSSDIDDRTLHEIYLQPFLKSIMAGVGSIMCSYSTSSLPIFVVLSPLCFSYFPVDAINGTFACENDKLMNDLIKRECGFQGCEYLSMFKNYPLTSHVVQLL